MGFWLATLNPGKPYRPVRRRRKLSLWQREVKRHGGVMQAIRARKAGGRKRRARGKRKLSLWQRMVRKWGGVKAALKHRRKSHKRRSAVSRRSLRSRSRRHHEGRPKMARTRRRRRRTPPRGRGGRFVSRRHRRSRRSRRNPVVPVSWNPGRRRRRRKYRRNAILPVSWNGRRRRSRRRNPLFLSRKGFSGRKHSGYRQLHRRRRHPRHWHNNPYLAINPSRRRRSHRRYRRNAILPVSWNPAGILGGSGPVGSIMHRAKSLVDVRFWMDTGVPAAVGFFGSKAAGAIVHSYTVEKFLGVGPSSPYYPFTKAAADTVAGAGLAWAVGRFYSKKAGDSIWLGTVVNVAYSLVRQLVNQFAPGVASSIGLNGLGGDLTESMKQAIAQRIQNGMAGMGTYLTAGALRPQAMGEYVTESALRRQPAFSPGGSGSDLRDYDPTNSEDRF